VIREIPFLRRLSILFGLRLVDMYAPYELCLGLAIIVIVLRLSKRQPSTSIILDSLLQPVLQEALLSITSAMHFRTCV